VALVAVAVAGAAACGGDDAATSTPVRTASKSPTPEIAAYFTKYKQLNSDAHAKLDQLDVTYPDAFKGNLKQRQDSFREYLKIFDETDDAYQALDVPAELRPIHDRAMAANEDGSRINHQRLDQLEAATEYSQVDAIFGEDASFSDAASRGDAACVELEDAAVDYGIAFDLPCER
jgi:hypothetical protein